MTIEDEGSQSRGGSLADVLPRTLTRRRWLQDGLLAAGSAAVTVAGDGVMGACWAAAQPADEQQPPFPWRYLLASCLFGQMPLTQIVPQVAACGATAIDIWPQVHGNQREQLDEMGEAAFAELLAEHKVQLGCISQYKLGPFGLADEIALAARLGCTTIVTNAGGPKDLTGAELKSAIADFVKKMQPHLAIAEQHGVTITIENHSGTMIRTPDSIRWLMDLNRSPQLKIALAPYHLPQEPSLIAGVIDDLADRLHLFYAWQYGSGSSVAQPKERELQQLPGRGSLDFAPLVAALRRIEFRGWSSIFMHSFPRGTSMLPTPTEITAEINRSRDYLGRL